MEKKVRILLVEDSEIARTFTIYVLNKMQCSVTEAVTGKQALSLSRKKEFDVILMDLGLPDTNGIDIAKKIKKRKGKSAHVPIIALTAHSDDVYKEACLKVGMSGFLVKPVTKPTASAIFSKLNLT